jgi:hypothetical protein
MRANLCEAGLRGSSYFLILNDDIEGYDTAQTE